MLACFERAEEFDVIHDHSGPPAAVIGGAVADSGRAHGPRPDAGEPGELYEQVGARRTAHRADLDLAEPAHARTPDLPWIANVPNALDFSFSPCSRAAATTCSSSAG